jgi:hypothetical protein
LKFSGEAYAGVPAQQAQVNRKPPEITICRVPLL